MSQQDARKQSREALAARRIEAVSLHRNGIPKMEICRRTGLSWPAADKAITLWIAGGDSALQPAARGRKPGSGRALTPEQETALRLCIRRRPKDHGLKDWLWTRETVRQLTLKKFGVELTVRAVGNYLLRWGVVGGDSSKAPAKRCAPLVRAWLATNLADLQQQTNQQDAAIYWLNKRMKLDAALWSRPTNDDGAHRASEAVEPSDVADSGPRDDDRPLHVSPARFRAAGHVKPRVSLISAANGQGKMFWILVFDTFKAASQTKFLRALLNDARRERVYLIRNDGKAFADVGDVLRVPKKGTVELCPPRTQIAPSVQCP